MDPGVSGINNFLRFLEEDRESCPCLVQRLMLAPAIFSARYQNMA